MKKTRGFFRFGFLPVLLFIALFNACDLLEDDDINPELPTGEVGTVLWTYSDFNLYPEPTEDVSITAPAIGPDGTIYVGSRDRIGSTWHNARLHAINPDSTFKWASPELDGVDISPPVIGKDGTIYVIGFTTVYSINPNSGIFNWAYQPPADSNEQHQLSWLTLGNNGQIFFAHIASGSYARRIYSLNSDGQQIWKRKVGWGANNLIVNSNGTLFAYWLETGDINTFGAINPNSGTSIWSTVIEGNLQGANGVAIATDGNLVISQSSPDKLIKINATSGELQWQVDAKTAWPSVSSDGSIYILCSDLYCYNPDGSLKWQTGSHTGCTPGKVAIDSDRNVYVSATEYGDGNFQVYHPDGSLKWAKYQNMNGQLCTAIGSNNVIYVVDDFPAAIYAIQGDKPLSSAGWPRDTGGNSNSRNNNIH